MAQTDTLLLVDDNQALVSIYARLLEEYGFRVLTAFSGPDALKLCHSPADVSLAIVDMKMPGLDGPSTIAQLQGRCPRMKVIAVSGGMLSPFFGKLVFLGVRHFLPKPFGIDGLLDSIADVCRDGQN